MTNGSKSLFKMTDLYPGQCPRCGDIHDPDGTPDEHGNRFIEEQDLCSNCVEEQDPRALARTLILNALDQVIADIQQSVIGEVGIERKKWSDCRAEVIKFADIVSASDYSVQDPKELPERRPLFHSEQVASRRKAVLELWNSGTMSQREIAEHLNESHYNVRQDLAQFRKRGYYVRPSAWSKDKD